MSLLLTFLGKGGVGRTTVAIAAAKKLAGEGSRVLLVGQDASPAWGLQLGVSPGDQIAEIGPALSVVQLNTARLLERSWEEVKELEKRYLRSPTLKNVYGQELGILPGMDGALALNALREHVKSGRYDAIVYDGTGDQNTLRMWGVPEVGGWYQRRFQKLFAESDLGRTLSPFVQPIAGALLSVSWNPDALTEKSGANLLEEGRRALSDPRQVVAYLVTGDDPVSIAVAKYLWVGAQQIGLNVGGAIFNRSRATEDFSPLPAHVLPAIPPGQWSSVFAELPNFLEAKEPPKPLTIDTSAAQVRVYLPGADKKAVKLTQSGPELTIEAGDQRRNIHLPPPLDDRTVKGARFQDGYLIVTL